MDDFQCERKKNNNPEQFEKAHAVRLERHFHNKTLHRPDSLLRRAKRKSNGTCLKTMHLSSALRKTNLIYGKPYRRVFSTEKSKRLLGGGKYGLMINTETFHAGT